MGVFTKDISMVESGKAGDSRNKEVVTGSATYEGETKDGMKHGMGTLTWDDGDQYVGEFRFDEKTTGTFRWKVGDTYTGEWKNSLMHGKGTYTYKNGRRYEGQWFCGYKQGFGNLFNFHIFWNYFLSCTLYRCFLLAKQRYL